MSLFRVTRVPMTAGSTVEKDLNAVLAQSAAGNPNYIKAVHLICRLVLVSAATSDAIAQGGFSRFIQKVWFRDNLGRPFLTGDGGVSGRFMRAMRTYQKKSGYNDPTAIAADSDTTNTVDFEMALRTRQDCLKNPNEANPLAAHLKGGTASVQYCAATEFGTGQVITQGSSYVDVCLDLYDRDRLEIPPDIFYEEKSPDTFDQYAWHINGKPLVLMVFRPDAAGVVASNDFTDMEIAGRHFHINYQNIDLTTRAYNEDYAQEGDDGAGHKALPSSGSAEDFPVFVAPERSKVSDLPTESSVRVKLVDGAGAPTTTEQLYGTCVLRSRSEVQFAERTGASNDLPTSRDATLALIEAQPDALGNRGTVPRKGSAPQRAAQPFLRKRLELRKG